MTNLFEFDKSYQAGKQGEQAIAAYLESIGRSVRFMTKDEQERGDLEINGKYTMEVKTDFLEATPHNFCIEYAVNYIEKGARNGGMYTKADFLCYYFIHFDVFYLITKEELAKLREEIHFNCRRYPHKVVQSTDFFSSLFLVPIKEMLDAERCQLVKMNIQREEPSN